jgi:GTPase SAR1 family protein
MSTTSPTARASTVPSSSGAKGESTKQTIPMEKMLVKIIVLGCANVGKTSIMER